ncbi:MAG: hypothetical protein CMJ49_13180 [Planctomycetaceae bacterium]|jgi:hypothetical protein|nr:hypothetical protein [Planctomycetaceae bacterium]
MPKEAEIEGRRSLARWVGWSMLALVVVVALYVLSIGPAVWCYITFDLYDSLIGASIEAFYWPLEQMGYRSETFSQFLDWYAELWRPD